MKKKSGNVIYVLDTNVLLLDPHAIYKFPKNIIVIAITVIEEIDKFKKDLSETGRNARTISRILDGLREKGKLSEGIQLVNGSMIRIEMGYKNISRIPKELDKDTPDNKILILALSLKEQNREIPVHLISKDINMRIKADTLGLVAEDYEAGKVEIDELYTGFSEMNSSSDDIDEFYASGKLKMAPKVELYPNQFLRLVSTSNKSQTAIGRYDKEKNSLLPLNISQRGYWGIHPKNMEQKFALDILLRDDVPLVTLTGKAGTGKTLLALAAGLEATIEQKKYQKILVSRPIFPLGRDIGFLPGDIDEKLKPWMQPIFDNLDLLLSGFSGKHRDKKPYQELLDMGMIDIEPLTYIRGRSIPNQFLIIDEAQNLTPHEVKTIMTRVGGSSKIIFTGDIYQIDNPYVDTKSNGLCYLVEKFKGEKLAGHISLKKGERSELAELAANIL